jgi:hypothetical protein
MYDLSKNCRLSGNNLINFKGENSNLIEDCKMNISTTL